MILDEHSGKIIEQIAVLVAEDIQKQYPFVDYLRDTVRISVTKVMNDRIEWEKTHP